MDDDAAIVTVQNASALDRAVTYDGQGIAFAPRERKLLTWGRAKHVLKHSVLREDLFTGAQVRWAVVVTADEEAPVLAEDDELAEARLDPTHTPVTQFDGDGRPLGRTTIVNLQGAGQDLGHLAMAAERQAPTVVAEQQAHQADRAAATAAESAFLDAMADARDQDQA